MSAPAGPGAGTLPTEAPGLRAIVAYKGFKAVAQTLAAIALTALILGGYTDRAHALAAALREHLVHHWAIKAAELLMRSLVPSRLWFLVAALGADAVVSAIEAWALSRGYEWAAWFVVAATSMLLPVEVIEVAHRTTAGRVILLLLNLAIVIYLLKRAMREHHARHPHPPRFWRG